MDEKEWIIEQLRDGPYLKSDRKYVMQRALAVWGYNWIAEEMHRLSESDESEWLPIWLHVRPIPELEPIFTTSFDRNKTSQVLMASTGNLTRGQASLLLVDKRVSCVSLERAVELWPQARHVLKDSQLRIRNIKTGEILAWECFE